MKYIKRSIAIEATQQSEEFTVETLEGTMSGKPGDYLVTGVNGEQYPCDKEIFEKTYVKVDNFIDRLNLEYEELENKYEKLKAFIISSKFGEVPKDQRKMLKKQKRIMEDYLDILKERIRVLNK